MTDAITMNAPAKVNLALSVGSLNDAGMHPIVSRMTTVGYGDDLEVKRLAEDGLSRYAILWHDEATRTSPINWPMTSDLAVRAHRAMEAHAGRALPVQMKLEKRLPVGSGLGGGSSDAAAMLRAVNELFALDLDSAALIDIASGLGSDIPFLICGGTAIISGLGEVVEPLDDTDMHMVLVMPDYGCATGEVYDAFDELGGGMLDESHVRNGGVFNDLSAAACEVASSLAADMAAISTIAEDHVHLSGSGSAMFVLCDNAEHASALAAAIEKETQLSAVATATTCNAKKKEVTQ